MKVMTDYNWTINDNKIMMLNRNKIDKECDTPFQIGELVAINVANVYDNMRHKEIAFFNGVDPTNPDYCFCTNRFESIGKNRSLPYDIKFPKGVRVKMEDAERIMRLLEETDLLHGDDSFAGKCLKAVYS